MHDVYSYEICVVLRCDNYSPLKHVGYPHYNPKTEFTDDTDVGFAYVLFV